MSSPMPAWPAGTSKYDFRARSSAARTRGHPGMAPRLFSTPAVYSSATASRMPEPQMPTAGWSSMV